MGPDAGITGCNSKACVTYEARLDDQNVPIWLKKIYENSAFWGSCPHHQRAAHTVHLIAASFQLSLHQFKSLLGTQACGTESRGLTHENISLMC